MPRNVERDALREKERRQNLMEAGLKLFSRNGIISVTLQDVADEANVGIATLYKYYQNRTNLVIAISANLWKNVLDSYKGKTGQETLATYNAYMFVESYLDVIIKIYKERPEILRFSAYFKTYMNAEKTDKLKDNAHLDVLSPISELFHKIYKKAQIDKSIRTDIDEQEMFTALALTMLGTAERYALGVVWAGHDSNDYTKELYLLKDMILNWLKVSK